VEQTPEVALSIYHPTERVAVEPEQNSLRLKNMLGVAHDQLAARGLRRPEIEAFMESLTGLLGNAEFWRHQLDGLAVFVAHDFFRYYRLPFDVPEIVVVADMLYTKPLLPALAEEGHFYVLALSQASVRLLRCTRFAVEDVDLDGLGIPRSLAEALQYDDLQKPELSHHPVTGPGQSGGPSVEAARGGGRRGSGRRHAFHGHGQDASDTKQEVLRYFQAVDAGISRLLGAEHAPLVLASVEFLQPIYRNTTSYRYVLEEGIEGNPDQISPADLHARALPIVEPELHAPIDAAVERFRSVAPGGLTSCDLAEVLLALEMSRVDCLFVARGEDRWGKFDLANGTVTVHDERRPDDVDLLDLAARETIRHGGDVYLVDKDTMPCNEPLGAIYRF
jgi:hypothetical protein